MNMTFDDMTILHAALVSLLHGDEEPWEDLSSDDMDRARVLLARLEAKVMHDEDGYEEDDDAEYEDDN